MGLEVIQPGLLTTVQDLGRFGYQQYGIIVSGAMDHLSLRLANLLVGNQDDDAALEITLMGPKLRFELDCLISICGGDLSPTINNVSIPLWRPVWVKRGSVLQFGKANFGCRAYLAIAGGIDVPKVMGSRSTYLRAGLGGLKGRSLKKGDRLRVNPLSRTSKKWKNMLAGSDHEESFRSVHWFVGKSLFSVYNFSEPIIRFIRGPQFERFTVESQKLLFDQPFHVSSESDRMGYRLLGANLRLKEPMELISEAVSFGTIQVPPSGQPILLMADRQTTGGYPTIGYAATVDLPILAQLKPGDKLRFKEIILSEAQQLILDREKQIYALKLGITSLAERGRV